MKTFDYDDFMESQIMLEREKTTLAKKATDDVIRLLKQVRGGVADLDPPKGKAFARETENLLSEQKWALRRSIEKYYEEALKLGERDARKMLTRGVELDTARLKEALKSSLLGTGFTLPQTVDQYLEAETRLLSAKIGQYRAGTIDLKSLLSQLSNKGVPRIAHNLQTLVRTQAAHVLACYHDEIYRVSGVERVIRIATLDAKTSDLCLKNHGKIYDIDKKPRLPAHYNCRSRYFPYQKDVPIETLSEFLQRFDDEALRRMFGATRAKRIKGMSDTELSQTSPNDLFPTV